VGEFFYWGMLGLGVSIALLLGLLAHLVAASRRRQTLKKLGFPAGSKLTAEHLQALHSFENTDTHLRKSFPKLSDRQREVIARDLLRDRGIIPKKRQSTASNARS
jgi:hypothetical protein